MRKLVQATMLSSALVFGSLSASHAAPVVPLTPPSADLLNRVKLLLEKPSTWDAIPKQVTLCIYSPDGAQGQAFQYAMSYLSELPKYTQMAKDIGIDFSMKLDPPFKMRIELGSTKLRRTATTDVQFRLYSDERVASEDFKAKRCDGIAMSNLRARQFNPFVGSLDAIGAVPSYRHLTEVIQVLAKPQMAEYMVNRDYEITGIMPLGAAYIMVNDRRINTLAKAAGKKVAVLDFDRSQAKLVQRIGAQPVSVDFTTLSSSFNNAQVDIMAAPAIVFNPFELYRGMTDSQGNVRGAIVRFPILQVTGVMMMHRGRFPEGLGQIVREYSSTQLAAAYRFIDDTEKAIPAKYWMDVPVSDRAGYQKLMRESRIDMTKEGFYDPRMMRLLKRVRCQMEPTHYECSLSDE